MIHPAFVLTHEHQDKVLVRVQTAQKEMEKMKSFDYGMLVISINLYDSGMLVISINYY
jgi:hypothetical protein